MAYANSVDQFVNIIIPPETGLSYSKDNKLFQKTKI